MTLTEHAHHQHHQHAHADGRQHHGADAHGDGHAHDEAGAHADGPDDGRALDPDLHHDGDGDHGNARHGHSHVHLEGATRLRSIGIDIGSATTHFTLSDIYVGKRDPRLAQKPEVLERRLVYQSPIIMTPFLHGSSIDAEALERFLVAQSGLAGFELAEIDTGALICTGEAARKDNAAEISERLSAISGRFVCATAGHHLEAVLGAHGAGAVAASRGFDEPLIALDVGGGTVKRTVIADGRIVHTSALNVGTRLLAFDRAGRLTRVERAGRAVAESLGVRAAVGLAVDETALEALAERMADSLAQFLGLEPTDRLTRRLVLTDGLPPPLPGRFKLMVSGGFAEYFYGRQEAELGDLGLRLSRAFRARLAGRLPPQDLLPSESGIRATVIGAGQFSLQVSGETVFLEHRLPLPLRGVPVHAVPLDWSDLSPDSVRRVLGNVLERIEGDGLCALSFRAAPYYGYGIARQLAESLAVSLGESHPERGVVLVFEQNVARTIGSVLSSRLPGLPVVCVDELEVGDLDYLDIGERPPGDEFVPVVVKTLVFS